METTQAYQYEEALRQAKWHLDCLPFRYHYIYEITPGYWCSGCGKTQARMKNLVRKGYHVIRIMK